MQGLGNRRTTRSLNVGVRNRRLVEFVLGCARFRPDGTQGKDTRNLGWFGRDPYVQRGCVAARVPCVKGEGSIMVAREECAPSL